MNNVSILNNVENLYVIRTKYIHKDKYSLNEEIEYFGANLDLSNAYETYYLYRNSQIDGSKIRGLSKEDALKYGLALSEDEIDKPMYSIELLKYPICDSVITYNNNKEYQKNIMEIANGKNGTIFKEGIKSGHFLINNATNSLFIVSENVKPIIEDAYFFNRVIANKKIKNDMEM